MISIKYLLGSVALGICLPFSAVAQVVPDATLGREASRVIDRSPRDFEIDGGARRGSNLFHSFAAFGIEEGGSVYFLNPSGVSRIFSRVTGAGPSNILGTLGVRGTANLLLLNPNGILLGPNARLDLGGSFTATTANAVRFGEQGFFEASQSGVSELLTIAPSAFLFNQIPPGSITNQAASNGLGVSEGQSILLVGGTVSLENARMFAPGGRVEIIGVGQPGSIGLNSDSSLIVPSNLLQADVMLNNAQINVASLTGNRGGTIAVRGEDLLLSSSQLRSGLEGQAAPALNQNATDLPGNIVLQATEAMEINRSSIQNFVQPGVSGNSGDIQITAENLLITGGLNSGSELNSSATGQGDAGRTSIRAEQQVILERGSQIFAGVGGQADLLA